MRNLDPSVAPMGYSPNRRFDGMRGGRSLSFSITQLFSGGYEGAWLDINTLSLLFTTYNGTTNVAVINDLIGRAERKAGTVNAMQSITTKRPIIKQYPNNRWYVYHDRVDDALELSSMPASTYTVAMATFAGAQIYEIELSASGALKIPSAEYTECIILNKKLSLYEKKALNTYLSAIMPIGTNDVLRVYSATNSVNLAITESGGSADATWEIGDGQTAIGTSCVKTITAPQSVILRAVDKTKITQINWSSKSLFGQICSLDELIALTSFQCQSNQLTGFIPSLSNNTALTTFYCSSNQLTGFIPSLSNNTALTTFQCQSNQLTGFIPSLSNNTALTSFSCSSNQLTGFIPSLSNNTALTSFSCYSNQLTGFIPSLSNNTALTTFYCSSNQLTGFIPSLSNNTALTYFQCQSNQLTGFIPSLSNNTALTTFQCQSNQLTGFIPSLSNNTALTSFSCSSNQLTGFIPSLSNNTALTTFQCQSNQLTGFIPSLSNNTALTTFYCYINQLTGSIPSLSNNTALTSFYCHVNQLTGSIPSLLNNTALTNFQCYSNQLTGFSGGTVSVTLGNFQAQNNLLDASSVNALLAAFVAAGRTSASGTCVFNVGGTGNAAPTGQGLTDKATLISRGWTVTTN